jgi:hypothetical protein
MKHFISLAAILSMNFKCRNCMTELTLPMSHEGDFKKLRVCPTCKNPWLLRGQRALDSRVEGFVNGVRELRSALECFEGVSLLLEIEEVSALNRS